MPIEKRVPEHELGCRDIEGMSTMHDHGVCQLKRSVATSARHSIDLTGETSDSDEQDDAEVIIGSLLKSGRIKCTSRRCVRRSFGRQAELRRHYHGAHAPVKLTHWCPVPLCERSSGAGGRPFHRKDKLRDHVRTMHGDASQTG
jgi:hypothetical protein